MKELNLGDALFESAKAITRTYAEGVVQSKKSLSLKVDGLLDDIREIAEENTKVGDGYDEILRLVQEIRKAVQS